MIKKLFLALLVVVIIALPVLTACGTSTSSTTATTTSKPATSSTAVSFSSTTAKTTTSSSTTKPSASSTVAAKPTKINIGLNAGITTLDPTVMNGGGGQAGNNVFEYLVGFDASNKMIPILAESWSFSSDFLTLTVKLKKGVVFSTGDPFRAADVVFSLEMYKAQPGPTSAQLTQNFNGVTIVDDNTVNFNFPAVNVQFLPQTLCGMFIMSKTQYDKVGKDEWVKNPAGTGPYKFVTFKEGQYCDITYNDKFRGAKPPITDAHYIYTADPTTRITQLQAGEVELIFDVLASSVAQLEKAGFTRYDIEQPHDICLQFGFVDTTVPWAKVEVRKAINYAIDKDALNNKLFGGVFKPGVWQLPWELGYDSSLKPAYPYDIAQARTLMSSAGYPNGFDMPIYYPTFMSWSKDMMDYLTASLSQIGIRVKSIACSDFGAMASSWLGIHNGTIKEGVLLFDVGWPGNPEPAINLTNGLYWKKDNTLFFDQPLNDLIDKILATPDNTARGKLVTQAYQKIDALLPMIPIFLEVTSYSWKSNIVYTPTRGGMQANPTNVMDLSFK